MRNALIVVLLAFAVFAVVCPVNAEDNITTATTEITELETTKEIPVVYSEPISVRPSKDVLMAQSKALAEKRLINFKTRTTNKFNRFGITIPSTSDKKFVVNNGKVTITNKFEHKKYTITKAGTDEFLEYYPNGEGNTFTITNDKIEKTDNIQVIDNGVIYGYQGANL